MSIKFREGDFVENKDGRIGYISHICHCERCKERGFYEPTVTYTDGTEDYISNYSVKNVAKYFKRIGKYDLENECKTNEEVDNVINALDELKKIHPEQIIIVETPNGSVDLKIGDALIYEGMGGEIVIDSE